MNCMYHMNVFLGNTQSAWRLGCEYILEPNNLEASTSNILQHSFDKDQSLPDPTTSINNENSSSETVKKILIL